MPRTEPPHFLNPPSHFEFARVGRLLRAEATGGVLLVISALLGFLAANTPLRPIYESIRDATFGPGALGLQLSIGTWASDGLLAIFFFLVGLELKREFMTGDLKDPRVALVPVTAAFAGVLVPALIYVAFNWGRASASGWAIPTATDIAFAVAVLGLLAPRLPAALRIFLLTLAVVDDLVAITIIAIAYTEDLTFAPLLLALAPLLLYAWLVRRFARWFTSSLWATWCILLPLGLVVWALVHASGIHATVAAVVLAFTVPVKRARGSSLAETLEQHLRPVSTAFAVPVFAFFAAGVPLLGEHRFPSDPIALGVFLGLVLGKPIGITVSTWILTQFTRAQLGPGVEWRDLIGVACLAGIGFTVSLLIVELSFTETADVNTAKLAVTAASICATVTAAVLLVRKRRPAQSSILARVEGTPPVQ